MTPAAAPVFELATKHPLPENPIRTERVVGGYRLEAVAVCKRGVELLSDYAAAMEDRGGHGAQQALIYGIEQAQKDGCAVEVRGFKHS